jgi:hypothetical protein
MVTWCIFYLYCCIKSLLRRPSIREKDNDGLFLRRIAAAATRWRAAERRGDQRRIGWHPSSPCQRHGYFQEQQHAPASSSPTLSLMLPSLRFPGFKIECPQWKPESTLAWSWWSRPALLASMDRVDRLPLHQLHPHGVASTATIVSSPPSQVHTAYPFFLVGLSLLFLTVSVGVCLQTSARDSIAARGQGLRRIGSERQRWWVVVLLSTEKPLRASCAPSLPATSWWDVSLSHLSWNADSIAKNVVVVVELSWSYLI